MTRVVIELDDDMAQRLRDVTHEPDLATAAKRVLEDFLADREAARLRAWEILLGGSGIGEGPGDLADCHDRYLYDLDQP